MYRKTINCALVTLLAIFALAICAKSGVAGPPLPPAVNEAPTITGAPGVSVAAGSNYTFTPTASDANGDHLTFSIVGKPSWATFSIADGTLSGTPPTVGNYSSIVITVSDGSLSASLAPFSIVVSTTVAGSGGGSTSRVPVMQDAWLLIAAFIGASLLMLRSLSRRR